MRKKGIDGLNGANRNCSFLLAHGSENVKRKTKKKTKRKK